MNDGQQLLGAPQIMTGRREGKDWGMRRLNRLPVFIALGLVILVAASIVFGLSSRGLFDARRQTGPADDEGSASSFAERLKRGVSDGIIGENPPASDPVPPAPVDPPKVIAAPQLAGPVDPGQVHPEPVNPDQPVQSVDDDWKERLAREHEEQILNERHRQKMARLQRADGARASPLRIDTGNLEARMANTPQGSNRDRTGGEDGNSRLAERLLSAAGAMGLSGNLGQDPNGQMAKQGFLSEGRVPLLAEGNMEVPVSNLTLKRGSIIPAMLMTGINADLPGRILAQVSQNVYDSVTGRHLLIPQGSRLVGRYDSKVSHGQSRVLVVWTDIVLADGKSLHIGSMAGIDHEGQAGFTDKVDRHLLRTFGSAALIALIGTGMDLALPDDRTLQGTDASDAARRSFSETFGRLAERTIAKNLDVQPTLSIRPGYRFNILVDQDLVFG